MSASTAVSSCICSLLRLFVSTVSRAEVFFKITFKKTLQNSQENTLAGLTFQASLATSLK